MLGGVDDLGGGILGVTASAGEWLVRLDEVIEKNDIFGNALSTAAQFITTVAEAIRSYLNGLKENFEFPVLDRISERMTQARDAAGEMKSGIVIAIEAIRDTLAESNIMDFVEGVWNIIKKIAEGSAKVVSTLFGSISGADFNSIFDIFNALVTGGIGVKIFEFFNNAQEALESIGGITEIFDGIRGCLEAYQSSLKADVLTKIATAVALLAASLIAVSLVDSSKLTGAIVGLSTLFGELVGSMTLLSKNVGSFKSVTSVSTLMTSMATSVLILAGALKMIGDLDLEGVMKGLLGISGLTTIIVAFSKIMESGSGTVIKGSVGLIAFASAMKILASACTDLASLHWDEIARGLTATGGLMLEVAAFTNLSGNASHITATGVSLIAIAAAMKIFASAAQNMASLSWEQLAVGLVGMAGALSAITIAVNLMPKNMVGIGVGLLAVSAALLVIANALNQMGSMSWEELGVSLAALGSSLALLAIGLNLMNGTLAGSAALLIAAGALAMLAPAMTVMGALSWEGIAKGLTILAGSFAVIGVAGLLLAPITPVIIGLSAALSLLLGSVSALILACSVSDITSIFRPFQSIADIFNIQLIKEIASLIPEFLIGILNAVTDMGSALLDSIATIIKSAAGAISECVPEISKCIGVVIDAVLSILVEYTPKVVSAAFEILLACLHGIADNISKVVQTAIDVVLGFLDGIEQRLPAVIQAGFDLLLSLIIGITDAIDKNTPLLVEAMKNLILTILEAAGTVLLGGVDLFKEIGNSIMNSGLVQGIKEKVTDLTSAIADFMKEAKEALTAKISEWVDIGKNLIGGLIKGFTEFKDNVVKKATEIGQNVIDGIEDLFGIHSPSKVFAEVGEMCDKGMIVGFKKYASNVSNSAEDVGNNAISAMKKSFSVIPNLLDFDTDNSPVIKPVLDLTNVQNGKNKLFKMMRNIDGYTLSGSTEIANETARIMNRHAYRSSDTSDEISAGKNSFEPPASSNKTFNNTFNITGSNPREIADEVSRIIQRDIEREDASWA